VNYVATGTSARGLRFVARGREPRPRPRARS